MSLTTITPREASIFACMTDALVEPAGGLPAVRDTDAAAFFDRWMARAPRLNRAGLRGILLALELGPRLTGRRGRMRRLPREERAHYLSDLERAGPAQLRPAAKLVKSICFLAYYGDDAVMKRVGYDADANVARARFLRQRDGRP
ncbi:MAG: hypothetical protein H0T15_03730 [Thermoleophilaceae bacterium]|nr:hypothetical protein [Thermoleophilaceae bacterium]